MATGTKIDFEESMSRYFERVIKAGPNTRVLLGIVTQYMQLTLNYPDFIWSDLLRPEQDLHVICISLDICHSGSG